MNGFPLRLPLAPLLPLILLLLVLLLWPLLILAERSVTGDGGRFTWESYSTILQSQRYLRALMNTAVLAAVSTLLALLICTPAALYLEGAGRGRQWVAVLLTIPLSLPGIVIGFFVILLFGLTGVVPQWFRAVTGERQLTFAYTFWGMLLGYLYFQIPRVVLMVRGAAATMPREAIAVARTLGASPLQVYRHVILPILRPALLHAASLSLATAFGAYGTAATLSRGYRVLPLEIAAAFTESFQPALAAGLSLVLVLITSLLLLGLARLAPLRG
jgi:putative spermidine/putrescine transport system permease protein